MRGILETPGVFNLWSRLTGDIPVKKKIISEFIRPFHGAKILDIGCGTGRMSELINRVVPVSYVGFDSNADYIEFAKQHSYPGTFFSEDITQTTRLDNDFDIVMALDMMHHVNDDQAKKVIAIAKKSLKPNGRFILLEPVITEQRSFFEKELMKLDRGKFIRKKNENISFLKESFSEIKDEILSDSYFIPWTECVFCCK